MALNIPGIQMNHRAWQIYIYKSNFYHPRGSKWSIEKRELVVKGIEGVAGFSECTWQGPKVIFSHPLVIYEI